MAECIFCGDCAGSGLSIPYGTIPNVGVCTSGASTSVECPCCGKCHELIDSVSVGSRKSAARSLCSMERETCRYIPDDCNSNNEEINELSYKIRSSFELSRWDQKAVKEQVGHCERSTVLGSQISKEARGAIDDLVASRLAAENAESMNSLTKSVERGLGQRNYISTESRDR